MTAQIDAIRKRLARITPGRWEWQSSMRYGDRKSGLYAIDPQDDETIEAVIEQTIAGILIRNDHDAAFIEHAPADVTALLAALDAANAEIARLRGENRRFYETLAKVMGIDEHAVMPAGEALYEQMVDEWLFRRDMKTAGDHR